MARIEDARPTCVITTNYDDYIERAIQDERKISAETNASLASLEIRRRFSCEDNEKIPTADAIDIYYLHGITPEEHMDRPGDLDPVLSEPDYYAALQRVQAVLSRAFTNSTVLIVEDVPSPVDLRWRPGDAHAAACSSLHGDVTAPAA
jgi:hypothetical protein